MNICPRDGPGGAPFDPSDFPSLGGGAGGALGGSGRNNYGMLRTTTCQVLIKMSSPSGHGETAGGPLFRVPDVKRGLPSAAWSAGGRAWKL